jgi:hypothetical protein
MIKVEADVRSWVRSASGGRARWVEAAIGGTPGLPDCWVPQPGTMHAVHLELKLAELRGDQLVYKVRADQRKEMYRMMEDHVPFGLLLGIKGTDTLAFVPPGRGALFGQIGFTGMQDQRYAVMSAPKGDFASGVTFLFQTARLAWEMSRAA